MSFTRRLFVAGSALLMGVASAAAQGFPTKPITMIVLRRGRGPTDVIARLVGEHKSPARSARRSWSRT